MGTIHVVRHGRTEANAGGLLLGRADPSLDEVGRDQAQALAHSLGEGIDRERLVVVSSPLRRCRETADAFGATVVTDERWIELDYGEFDLVPAKDIPREVWDEWRADVDFAPPGGESHRQLATRVSEALQQLAEGPAAEPEATVIVVSHVSPIKAAMAWALGVGIEISWRSFVAQASVTSIGIGVRGPSLQAFNETHHVEN